MTDQTPMDGFETRMTALVRSYTEPAAKPIDAVLTARTAMASRTRERRPRRDCGRSATTDAWPGCSSSAPSS